MAGASVKSLNVVPGSGTSQSWSIPSDVAENDLIILAFCPTGNVNTITPPSGYTAITMSDNSAGTTQYMYLYRKQAGASESLTPSIGVTTSRNAQLIAIVVENYNTSNPINVVIDKNSSSGSHFWADQNTGSTTVDDCLLLDIISVDQTGAPWMPLAKELGKFEDSSNSSWAVYERFLAKSGSVPVAQLERHDSYLFATLAIEPSGGDRKPYVNADTGLYFIRYSQVYTDSFTTINGVTCLADNDTGNFDWEVNTASDKWNSLGQSFRHDINSSATLDRYYIGENDFPSQQDLTSTPIILTGLRSEYNPSSKSIASIADGGLIFGVITDKGNAGEAYRVWTIGGKDDEKLTGQGSYNAPVIIDISDASNCLETSGTFDITKCDAVFYGVRLESAPTNYCRYGFPKSLGLMSDIEWAGGSANAPIAISALNDIFTSVETTNFVEPQGVTQFLTLGHHQVGDGTDHCYADLSNSAIEFVPRSVSGSNTRLHIPDNMQGLTYYPDSAGTILHKNAIVYGSHKYEWGLHASAPSGATYEFDGLQVIGPGTRNIRDIGEDYTNLTISGGEELNMDGGSLSASCTIDNTEGTQAVTVTGVNEAAVQAELDDVACKFTNNAIAIQVDYSGSLSLSAPTGLVMGSGDDANTVDIHYTGTGTLTFTNNSTSNATTETSPSGTVTFVNPSTGITFNGLVSGSQVVVFDTGTQTEEFRTDSSGTSEQWSDTGDQGTVDYTIMKAGYLPIRETVAVGTSALTITVNQETDPAYAASSGLTHSTDTLATIGTKKFDLSKATTTQNFYSFWIENWIAQSAYVNQDFPLQANGPTSIILKDGWEFTADSHITSYITRGGFKYWDSSDVLTAEYASFQSAGDNTGHTAEFQQVDGAAPTDAANSGTVDQCIKIYGDATHGNFDYRSYMIFKSQPDGYRPAVADLVDLYGTLEARNYVFALQPEAIAGASTGDPGVTGLSFTNHGASPETWQSKSWSGTLTDTGGNTAENIRRWWNYNNSLDATFQGEEPFNHPEIFVPDGDKIKTEYGDFIGTAGATLKGVRAIDGSGDPLSVFSTMQADDGTLYTVPVTATATVNGMPNVTADRTVLQITNETGRAASAWSATTAVSAGDYVTRSTGVGTENNGTGLFYVADSAGTTGGSEPTFPTTPGDTVTDNGITWTCRAVQYYNGDPAAASYTSNYTDGEEIASGDTVRVRFAELDEYTSFNTFATTTVATADGFTVSVDESADSIYATNAVDGSVVTKFTADFANDEIDLSANANFTAAEAYAFYCYTLTSADGVEQFWGGVTAIDVANYRINTSILNLYIDNTTTASKRQTDSARIFRDDEAYPVKDPTTSGYGVQVNWQNQVFGYAISSGITTQDKQDIADNVTSSAEITNLTTKADDNNRLLKNKRITDQSDGKEKVYADNDTDVLYEGDLYEDADGTQAYRGQGAERRDRLVTPS